MAKNNRVPLSQLGADAFFGPPVDRTPEPATEVKQDTTQPAKQHTAQPANRTLKKVSYYIYADQDVKMLRIILSRAERGISVDKSELVREALDLLGEE